MDNKPSRKPEPVAQVSPALLALAALLNIDTTRRGWQRIVILTAKLEIERLRKCNKSARQIA